MRKFNLYDTDLDLADRCAARRQYRILRLAIYAPSTSKYSQNGMLQMEYGMGRDEAREFLRAFYMEVSWKNYIGSK